MKDRFRAPTWPVHIAIEGAGAVALNRSFIFGLLFTFNVIQFSFNFHSLSFQFPFKVQSNLDNADTFC